MGLKKMLLKLMAKLEAKLRAKLKFEAFFKKETRKIVGWVEFKKKEELGGRLKGLDTQINKAYKVEKVEEKEADLLQAKHGWIKR